MKLSSGRMSYLYQYAAGFELFNVMLSRNFTMIKLCSDSLDISELRIAANCLRKY